MSKVHVKRLPAKSRAPSICWILCQLMRDLITAHKRSWREGNVFTGVCHSVHRKRAWMGCVAESMRGWGHAWLRTCMARGVQGWGGGRAWMVGVTHALPHIIGKWAVCILLECWLLVILIAWHTIVLSDAHSVANTESRGGSGNGSSVNPIHIYRPHTQYGGKVMFSHASVCPQAMGVQGGGVVSGESPIFTEGRVPIFHREGSPIFHRGGLPFSTGEGQENGRPPHPLL